jgi:hypothetical protein
LMMRVKRSFMSILIYICPSDFLLGWNMRVFRSKVTT